MSTRKLTIVNKRLSKLIKERKVNFYKALKFGVHKFDLRKHLKSHFFRHDNDLGIVSILNDLFEKECNAKIKKIVYKCMKSINNIELDDTILKDYLNIILYPSKGKYPKSIAHRVCLEICEEYKDFLKEIIKSNSRKHDLVETHTALNRLRNFEESNNILLGLFHLPFEDQPDDPDYKCKKDIVNLQKQTKNICCY